MQAVFFRWPCGNGFEVNYSKTKSIKQLLYQTQKIPSDSFQIKVISNNIELKISQTLPSNNIEPSSILHLIKVDLHEEKDKTTEVLVYWQKSFLSFVVNCPEKILDLKQKITEKIGLPIEEQILVFQSKKLKNNDQITFSKLSVLSLVSDERKNPEEEEKEKKKRKHLLKKFSSGNYENKFVEENPIKPFFVNSANYQEIKQSENQKSLEYGPSLYSQESIQEEDEKLFDFFQMSGQLQNFFVQEDPDKIQNLFENEEVVVCESVVYESPKTSKKGFLKKQSLNEKKVKKSETKKQSCKLEEIKKLLRKSSEKDDEDLKATQGQQEVLQVHSLQEQVKK